MPFPSAINSEESAVTAEAEQITKQDDLLSGKQIVDKISLGIHSPYTQAINFILESEKNGCPTLTPASNRPKLK